MKKSFAILALVAMVISACSQYTCPTYSKAPAQKTGKESRI
jgi:PBP1b-binding outer membrane lipoprotein LpoB